MNTADERHNVHVQVLPHYIQTFKRFISSFGIYHWIIGSKAIAVSIYLDDTFKKGEMGKEGKEQYIKIKMGERRKYFQWSSS